MPESRKRKVRHRGGKDKSKGRSSKNSRGISKQVIVILIIASFVIVIGLYFWLGRTTKSTPASVGGTPVIDGQTVTTASGLKYVDEVVGNGPSPQAGQTVTVHYTGTLDNGKKFDSSVDRGQPYRLVIGTGQVIKGWDEGIMSMKVGGKRRLIVPPDLGYGAAGMRPSIPSNATLNFEVELLGVN